MKTPITYYGGKQRLLKELLSLIPKHKVYIEAFTGGGALFFAKPPSEVEIINDFNGNVTNFYSVLQTDFEELKKLVNATLHSRAIYKEALKIYKNADSEKSKEVSLKKAWAFWVLTNQGFSGKIGSWALCKQDNKVGKTLANKRKDFTKEYAERLECVQIESEDAIRVVKHYDTKEAFIYADPPYFNSDCGHYKGYKETDFRKLLDTLVEVKGKFLLSSYPSELLKEYIEKNEWYYREIKQKVRVNHKCKNEKIEILVYNYKIENTASKSINKPTIKNAKQKEQKNKKIVVQNSAQKSKQKKENNPIGVENSKPNYLHTPNLSCNFDDSKENLDFSKQLSIEKCSKILGNTNYSPEEILKIRHLLYKLGNLDYQLFTQLKKTKDAKLHSVRESINGRTSRQRNKYSFSKGATLPILHTNRR